MKTQNKPRFQFKNSPIPIVIVDGSFSILNATNAVYSFFELEKDNVVQQLDQILGELPKVFITAAANYEQCIHTIPIIGRDGQQRWIRTTLFPAHDISKSFQVYFDDVTIGKTQFELAIQATQIAKIGSWHVDLVKNKVTWSDTTKDIHEVEPDFEPNLESGINFYKEGEHREKIVEAVSECIESGKAFDVELIIVTAKNNEKWVRAIGEAERNNGKTTGFKGVFQDIDEIKRERLRNEILDHRMRVAVKSANIGIWDWDVANNHLIWDENMFTLFGVDRNDFDAAYEAWESAVHPEDKERANFEVGLALEGKKPFDTEFRIIKEGGEVAYIQGRGQVVWDASGKPLRMIGINMDITKMKRKDERLRSLLEVTEKQNQKLINFAHIVSHNLRSNSSNISMISGMLLSDTTMGKTESFLQMIQKSSDRLEETLNQLNEIVKVQATDHSELRHVKVVPLLESVCDSINAIIEESGAELKIELDEKLAVYGIKAYLTSIFMNLLTNSIKYRNPDKQLKIHISAEDLGNQILLAFKDNGLGIDLKKHAKKIFGMYKTFHNNKDAKGIGLFLSKNQMEAMNGKIEVKSEIDKGSTFFLYFRKQ